MLEYCWFAQVIRTSKEVEEEAELDDQVLKRQGNDLVSTSKVQYKNSIRLGVGLGKIGKVFE